VGGISIPGVFEGVFEESDGDSYIGVEDNIERSFFTGRDGREGVREGSEGEMVGENIEYFLARNVPSTVGSLSNDSYSPGRGRRKLAHSKEFDQLRMREKEMMEVREKNRLNTKRYDEQEGIEMKNGQKKSRGYVEGSSEEDEGEGGMISSRISEISICTASNNNSSEGLERKEYVIDSNCISVDDYYIGSPLGSPPPYPSTPAYPPLSQSFASYSSMSSIGDKAALKSPSACDMDGSLYSDCGVPLKDH
jgi:hypothetical protein